jgi:transcriptional regulator with XRE-family HTH domain
MTAENCLSRLEERRRKLGMSMKALARRSGVSLPTVQRILSGGQTTASFESIIAISHALGVEVELREEKSVHEFTREGAREKARRLVSLVQGTSGLEGQAVDADKLEELTDQALHTLLAGSRRKLWAD